MTATVYARFRETALRRGEAGFLNVLPETADIYGIPAGEISYRAMLDRVENRRSAFASTESRRSAIILEWRRCLSWVMDCSLAVTPRCGCKTAEVRRALVLVASTPVCELSTPVWAVFSGGRSGPVVERRTTGKILSFPVKRET